MDIEDIERHKYNFRLFCMFLKQKKIYQTFKKLMFIDFNKTPYDLFVLMNETNLNRIIYNIDGKYCVNDKKWSAVFTYIPFSNFYWGHKKGEIIYYDNMIKLTKEWCDFLVENNYDKLRK